MADALGMSPTAVVGTVGAGVLGMGGIALGNKVLPRKKSIPQEIKGNGDNKGDHSTSNHVDSQHGNSFHQDIKNYTEDYGVRKEHLNEDLHEKIKKEKYFCTKIPKRAR